MLTLLGVGQGQSGGFPQACFGLDYNTITSDFTFTRNSFATRVNENGLIETVTNLGSNLVQNGNFDELGTEQVSNGDFENGDTDWTIEAVWTIQDGVASGNGANGSAQELTQSNVTTVGKTYKVTYDILNYVSGSVVVGSGGLQSGNGTFTEYWEAVQTTLKIRGNGFFDGDITNVSVKQVDPNDDWLLNNTTWKIGDGIATADGTASGGSLQQIGVVPSGTSGTYKFEWTQEITSGTRFRVIARNGNNSSGAGVTFVSGSTTGSGSFISGNCVGSGTFTVEVETTVGFSIWFLCETGVTGTIDNVSVVEVIEDDVPRIDYTGSTFDVPVLGDELITNGDFENGDTNWNLNPSLGTAIVSNGKLNFTNSISSGTQIMQRDRPYIVGKTYKITYTITDYVQGHIRLSVGNNITTAISSNGTFTQYKTYTAGADSTYIYTSNATLSIDNISVKEVTAYTTTDKGAFLLEPQSTNLILNSNIDNSIWSKVRSSVSTNEDAPTSDGSDGYLLTEDTSLATTHYVIENATVVAGDTYTISAFFKPNGRNWVQLSFESAGYSFDIENGVVGTSVGTPLDYSINEVGNGFYRVSVTANAVDTVGRCQISLLDEDNSQVYDGDGVSGAYIYGVQLEHLSYATSYIPTSGTTVTRAQESCLDGTVVANSDEGVLYWEGSSPTDSTVLISELSQGNITNAVRLYYQNGSDSRGAIRVSNVQTTINGGGTLDVTKKIAVVWGNNVIDFWVNGVKVNTDTYVGSIPEGVLTALNFAQVGGAADFIGRTKDLKIYDKALTDEELIELTTI